ncbi:alpha/beta hydrolase [Dermacoccaceae bacterium W4C1]
MDNARTLRLAKVGGAALSAGAGLTGAGTFGVASYFARRVLTPEASRRDDALIVDLDITPELAGAGSVTGTVTFRADAPSTVPGQYGLWLEGGRGHARIGQVLEHDTEAHTVTRQVLGVDRGVLERGSARWSGYYFVGPPWESLGLDGYTVQVESELGPVECWAVPAADQSRWAVLVHGRGALREECLRAVGVLHESGISCLIAGYRNDEGAPASIDGRYGLGLHEWRDVDAAMRWTVAAGATEIQLFGWSMGGSIVLQTLASSAGADRVSRVVLDAPALNWADVMRHQAHLHRLPSSLARLGGLMMGGRASSRLVGLHQPLEIGLTDWVTRADELRHRMLLIHSVDDDFVPYGPSEQLAAARPDLVTWVPWDTAQHCREWNTDPQRWESAVRDFCSPR